MTIPVGQIDAIRSARFRAEREASWKELEALLLRVEKQGVSALDYDDIGRFSGHYRQAMNALSVARAISMDKALLAYLEALCARSYLVVYAPQESLGGIITGLLTRGIPQAFRRSALPLAIGFAAMLLGALVGWTLFFQDQSWFFTFVPGDLASGRTPSASVEYLRSTLFDGDDYGGDGALTHFATYLLSHNTQVAILAFALGVFATAPSFLLTFYNGLILGSFYAVFADKGLGYEAAGWLSIHGVTEISAFCVAAAGGARMGMAVLLPGEMGRATALRHAGHDAVKLLILAALMLLVAAILEGFFRQIVTSTEARLAIGWGAGVLWLAWLMLAGRQVAKGGRA
jgi:uncharacterized membrane protein SpoIIM required for sporulation